jgi:hypothetical protein
MKLYTAAIFVFFLSVSALNCRRKLNGNQAMVELLSRQQQFEANPSNPYSCAEVLKRLDSTIWISKGDIDIAKLYAKKANVLLQLGQEQRAVHLMDSVSNTFIVGNPNRLLVARTLALAYLRLGERTNCINNHTAESCIFPIAGTGIHLDRSGSEKAIMLYEKILKQYPDDDESRWLLNIAFMTVGGYPQDVPAPYLLKMADTSAYQHSIKPFKDVAMDLGLATRKMAGGSIVEDFNNDGYPDIVTSSFDLTEHMHYFKNNKNGTFTDLAASSGLGQFTGGLNMMQTDYNNDGLKDIFVLRGGWKGKFGKEPNSLLRNNGDGTFTDVTGQSGLLSMHPTQTATWADFNNDGWLDVFIGNESEDGDINPSELYINNKNGTFTEVAVKAGCALKLFVKGVTAGDYNNDGKPDIFISTMNGRKVLLKNVTEKNGPVKFVDVSKDAKLTDNTNSTFATWFWDYDNDGWPDILACGYGNYPIAAIAGAEARNQNNSDKGKIMLYHNQHDGTFKEVSKEAGFNKIAFAMGANFGDIDNDGYLDFYLGTGNPLFSSLIPNRLYKNEHGTRFTEITGPARVGSLQKGHAVAFADMNNDGSEDIFVNQGGAYPGDAYQNALYLNPGQNNNNWINLLLEGATSNKAAIGARLKITFTENGHKRSVYREVNSGGSFGANPLRQHIGIGNATIVDELEIKWPASGMIQRFSDMPVRKNFRIKEGSKQWAIYNLTQFNFTHRPMPQMSGMKM